MCKPLLITAVLLTVSLAARNAIHAQETSAEAQITSIGIRLKVFDADRPGVLLTPRLAFGYYRPGEGQEPLFLNELDFAKQEDGFYVVTVPKGILLERLVILVQESNYNASVLTKIVTANNMVVYPAASDSTGVFSFQGYKGQMTTYLALYDELVEDLALMTPDSIRELFGKQILDMPQADDVRRLPGLDGRQRSVSFALRQQVLQTYGFTPKPDPHPNVCPGPQNVYHGRGFARAHRRFCRGCQRRCRR